MKRTVPDEKIAALLKAARGTGIKHERNRDWLFLALVANTGLRVGEAIRLTVGDCYGLGRTPPFLSVQTLKRRKPIRHDVFLPEALAAELRRVVVRRKTEPVPGVAENEPLFRSRLGLPISVRSAQRIFKRHAARAGLDPLLSIHSLRHSYATRVAHVTRNAYLVKRALRHGDLRTSATYVDEEDLIEGLKPVPVLLG